VLQAIHDAQGNYMDAAKSLGLHATNLHRLIRNLGLKDTIAKK
jgi:transcriptional regulator with GAF, ATPase, and Fis domain